MAGLLYKNLRQNRGYLILILGIQLLCGIVIFTEAYVLQNNKLVGGMAVLVFCLMTILVYVTFSEFLFKADEVSAWCDFVIASPVGADGQIRSKYYFILAEYILVMVLNLMIDAVAGVIQENGAELLRGYLLIFAVILLLTTIEIPFLAFFGVDKGSGVKLVVLLTVVLVAAIYFLFGDLAIFKEENVLAVFNEKMNGAVQLYKILLMCGISLILYYASYRISVRLYRNRVDG